jgi:protease I
MPKVLMPIGDASEVLDTMYPYFRLPEDGFDVVVAGPEKRIYHLVEHDTHPDWDITIEKPGYNLRSHIAFRDVNPDEYAGLFLSGGRAPEYLRDNADLVRIIKHFFERNKPVASLCHGIELVAVAGALAGRTATTVKKCRLDIEFAGGKYVDEPVVVSGNLVTARAWQDNTTLLREFIKMLKTATR